MYAVELSNGYTVFQFVNEAIEFAEEHNGIQVIYNPDMRADRQGFIINYGTAHGEEVVW